MWTCTDIRRGTWDKVRMGFPSTGEWISWDKFQWMKRRVEEIQIGKGEINYPDLHYCLQNPKELTKNKTKQPPQMPRTNKWV